jgi:hypothetical protein
VVTSTAVVPPASGAANVGGAIEEVHGGGAAA